MKRIMSSDIIKENEKKEENNIRPSRLDDFVGQDLLKQNLRILIGSAKKRHESMDHILLSGPPGLGKTTVANIIATEMGSNICSTSGPTIKKGLELISILAGLKKGDVLFIDEIHRLSKNIEEILYPAMEDFEITIILKEGRNSNSKKIKIAPFTLIGATTKSGLLESPFRDRFGYSKRLNLYSIEELEIILSRSSQIMHIFLTKEAKLEIAKRSRGTPRIANRLLRRVRDYYIFIDNTNNKIVDLEIATKSLDLLGIDSLGLDEVDKRIIQVIVNDYDGGPVGLKTISISIGEDVRTIEEVYEPYLIQIGFIKRTPQGRSITTKGRKYLGINTKFNLNDIDNIIMIPIQSTQTIGR